MLKGTLPFQWAGVNFFVEFLFSDICEILARFTTARHLAILLVDEFAHATATKTHENVRAFRFYSMDIW